MKLRIDQLAIDTLRVLSIEEIAKAKSGHPGIALGASPIIHTLYSRILHLSSQDNKWVNRDRFVMSAGHGSSLLYAVLYLYGYLEKKDLESFRQLGSLTPGHPEVHLTKGVDVSTGPLGQGIAMACGMAIAEAHLHAKFPKLINHYTYVLCGDGDLQEGVAVEAISLAGNLQLNKLIVLYDSNDIQLDGPVKDANTEDTKTKFMSMNWNYLRVEDGNSVEEIYQAILSAQKQDKPTLIEVKTVIGFGSHNAGTSKVHGSPLGDDEVRALREKLGLNPFDVPKEVIKLYEEVKTKNDEIYAAWEKEAKQADLLFNKYMQGDFIVDWEKDVPSFTSEYNKATRVSSGEVLNVLSKINPMLMGGSADLSSSTNIRGADGVFTSQNRLGRDLKFGVREHAMGAIVNGITLHQGLRGFASGFFVFSDYMKPAIRLSALMELPVIYIFTHDSIAVGEDGPTHQPIEQLTMLRSIPNVNLFRPADANEVKAAYKIALESTNRPTIIVLSRQNLPTITPFCDLNRGAYILHDVDDFEGILLASGSEVSLAMQVQERLSELGKKVRVISIPSTNLFDRQSEEYKNMLLPPHITKRIAIEMSEAAHLYKYVGLFGKVKGINSFGKSGKGPEVIEDFGFNVEEIVKEYLQLENVDIIRYIK